MIAPQNCSELPLDRLRGVKTGLQRQPQAHSSTKAATSPLFYKGGLKPTLQICSVPLALALDGTCSRPQQLEGISLEGCRGLQEEICLAHLDVKLSAKPEKSGDPCSPVDTLTCTACVWVVPAHQNTVCSRINVFH